MTTDTQPTAAENTEPKTYTVQEIFAYLTAQGLSIQSVNLEPGDYETPAKWNCTISREIKHANRPAQTVAVSVEYTMGAAHRVYNSHRFAHVGGEKWVKESGETCNQWRRVPQIWGKPTNKQREAREDSRPMPPELTSVVWSLLMDWDCVDGRSFPEFCEEMGYNADSIKDRDCYLACQESGAKLRKLGLDLDKLHELYQDF